MMYDRPQGSLPGPRGSRGWGTLRGLLVLLFLCALLGGALYGLYLDQVVRSRFEGQRWAVPARVYAQPLELYAGVPVGIEQMLSELKLLGYRAARRAETPGSYVQNGDRLQLRSRSFQFWDGSEPERLLDLEFTSAGLRSLKDGASGADLPLVRLDAPVIGSIYPAHNEDRVLVQRAELPELLVQALLAVEDRDFYQHHGLDPKAMGRALWANLRAGGLVQGGSTLTQQLVKNFYLNRERTLGRKLNEALMALLLDWHYDKDAILEAYANEIFLGQEGNRAVHGFGLASYHYFNRPLNELDLPRIALLVGLVKGPSQFEPRRHPERATERRNLVLEVLRDQGVIAPEVAARAMELPLGVTVAPGQGSGSYPAFIDLLRRQLRRDYRDEDLTSAGLRIFTTLDPWIQTVAEDALQRKLPQLEKRGKASRDLEGAIVVTSTEGGEVLALVGGREPRYAGFNRALDALRPIGSLIKPVVYLEALARPTSYTLVTRLDDSAVRLKDGRGEAWSPDNYDHRQHGRVPLYEALAQSYNLATVHLGLDVGLERVAKRLQELGATRAVEPYPSLLLGAVTLPPIEVAQIYESLAAGGFRSPLRAIREVLGADGNALQRYPITVEQAAPSAAVFLVTWAMQQVVSSGTARALGQDLGAKLRLAGKTGTTNDLRDSWFAGFSADKMAVVWVGRDDNQPAGLSGATGAMQVWGELMRRIRPLPLNPVPPEGVSFVRIDSTSGMLAGEGCSRVRDVPFARGSAPTLQAECQQVVVDDPFERSVP
jgi:penicillin-binding protein 1B